MQAALQCCLPYRELLHPDEGNLDHVAPRSRGGADTWKNLVWSAKRKADAVLFTRERVY
jgi:5-methylcytosine-specific restriction endonuclease McrA